MPTEPTVNFPEHLLGGPTIGEIGEFEVIRVITEQASSTLNGD
ncbi:MAG: thiamine-phosphate kinase, partial [Corynebacterium sp.]|nr:thiamine-phosphate kinase [Corynebacterium sp.]